MTGNLLAAVKGLQLQITPEVAPDDDHQFSDAEKAELKARAINILAEAEIERIYRAKAFDRPPTELESKYEAAAIGVVQHFGNTHLESLPCRFLEVMPEGYKGVKFAGIYEETKGDPQILLKHRGDAEAEYRTWAHECGHAIDNALRGDARFNGDGPAAKAEREALADKYRDIILGWGFERARMLFYGNKKAVTSIGIDYILKAMAE